MKSPRFSGIAIAARCQLPDFGYYRINDELLELQMAKRTVRPRFRLTQHSDGGRQEQPATEEGNAENQFAQAHWEVHMFPCVFTQVRPLPCVLRRPQRGASLARSHNGGSRTAQEWDRDIPGSYTYRPLRLSSSWPPFFQCLSAWRYSVRTCSAHL
jgi:hypothetical protein